MDIEIKENTIKWKRNRYIYHYFGNTECFVRVFLITVFLHFLNAWMFPDIESWLRRFLQGASFYLATCSLFVGRKTGELVTTAKRCHQFCYLIISILLNLKCFHFHQSGFQKWPASRMRPLLRCHLEIPKNCQISHGRRRLTEIRAVTWWRRQNSSANRQTKPGWGLIGKKTSHHHLPHPPHPHLSEGHRILPVHLVSSDCPS